MSRTLSWYLMLPGLIRRPWIPASSAAIAYFHWKWMSATTGTVDFAAIALRASASSRAGRASLSQATRSLPEHLEQDLALLRLVHLEQDEPLPPAEGRLAGD